MDLWQFLGNLHPKLVHFPLVLLLAGLVFDAVGLAGRSERCHWAGKILTSAGTISLLFAFICGVYAEVWAGRAGIPQDQIELHELFANIASWGFVVLAAWRLFLRGTGRRAMLAYLVIGFIWYGLMLVTAHLGGELIFDYGAAVTGARANSAISLHDLNTLATRQTDLNLRYSEMMHHIFGYLTLALAGSLFVHALFPRQAHRLTWIGPLLLLLGGVFLFFCADLDLYRLTDLRQLRDREVQLHKTLAIILAVVGIVGLRRRSGSDSSELKNKNPHPNPPPEYKGRGNEEMDAAQEQAGSSRGLALTYAAPSTATAPKAIAAGYQGKLVAVMALIGGGMLFTHVHTVAPYANVAAGVYVAHIVLGSVALAIGATRLLADALPRRRQALSVAFAALLCVEAGLLITYNEGLPWYIGYGHYNRWGAHNGTIAPYGSCRAELTFDNASQRLDVYLLDRFSDTPAPIMAKGLDVLIDRGYQEMAVHVLPADGNPEAGEHSHFSATALFLKDAPAFCARLALPMGKGSDGSSEMKMGYFDPWVTPVIAAVPPNEVAKYECPMHEGIRSTSPGNCPLCGMPMVAINNAVRMTLHDPAYAMNFSATSLSGSNTSRHLVFTPMREGQILTNLAITHEHLLHLIIVTSDLARFDHVHPIRQSDGSLTLDYDFKSPGHYLLFADITPMGDRNQVFRFPVTIGSGDASSSADDPGGTSLTLSAALASPLAQDPSITAELIPTPREMVAGLHTQLLVRLTRNGQPLTDLQPYLGAMGHCVIISEDTQTYLHCHPEQLWTPSPTDRGGPDVVFHTHFPRPGRYKMWAQFNRGGKVLVADFVIQVDEPILPPKVLRVLLDD